jgi:hypothetical protein
MTPSYYAHPFVSNSDLSGLARELQASDQAEYSDALRFGTLMHAMVLEPDTVDMFRRRVFGHDYEYADEEIRLALRMKLAFLNDAFCSNLLKRSEKEVEMYNPATRFTHEGFEFTIDTRRKYDGYIRSAGWGWDLKSTTATTKAGFEAAIARFDYDRARVFYAKGPGAIQDVIIGISKRPPHHLFKVFMKMGDPLWQSGEAKCNELAFKWWALKSVTV